jgi:O-antigen ligase
VSADPSASPRGAVLLGILFGGLLLGGLRAPLPACAAAAALWALALASPRWSAAALAPWAPFLAWCAVCAALSAQPLKSSLFLARWGGFAALLLLLPAEADARLRRLWLYGLWLAGAAAALAALWTGGRSLVATGAGNELTGFLPPYYNYTAFVEAAAAAAAIAALVRERREDRGAAVFEHSRSGLGLLAAFLTLMILAARARGAALALAFAVAVTVCRARAWRALAGLAAAGAVAALAATGGNPARLLKREHAASFQRPAIWRAAAAIAGERPLLGEGPGNFEHGYLRHRGPADFRGLRFLFSTPYAHSEPLQAAAETGWLGLALLLWALWRSRPRGGTWSAEREAALAAACAMLAHGLVDNMTQLAALGFLIFAAWLLAGEAAPAASAAPARPAWKAVAAAALLLSLAAWVPQAAVDRARAPAPSAAERLQRLQAAVRLFPADAGLRGDLARAWLSQTPPRPDLAWPQLVRARALDPFNALYPGLQAEFARAKGDWAAEEAFARAALELEPNYALARLQLAEARARQGDRETARAELEETGRRRGAMDPNGCASGYGAEICRVDEPRLTEVESLLARSR